jgi:hypothetical protein
MWDEPASLVRVLAAMIKQLAYWESNLAAVQLDAIREDIFVSSSSELELCQCRAIRTCCETALAIAQQQASVAPMLAQTAINTVNIWYEVQRRSPADPDA